MQVCHVHFHSSLALPMLQSHTECAEAFVAGMRMRIGCPAPWRFLSAQSHRQASLCRLPHQAQTPSLSQQDHQECEHTTRGSPLHMHGASLGKLLSRSQMRAYNCRRQDGLTSAYCPLGPILRLAPSCKTLATMTS